VGPRAGVEVVAKIRIPVSVPYIQVSVSSKSASSAVKELRRTFVLRIIIKHEHHIVFSGVFSQSDVRIYVKPINQH
jgi:hypothetical protein